MATAIDGLDAVHDMVCGPRPVKQRRNRPLLARQRLLVGNRRPGLALRAGAIIFAVLVCWRTAARPV
jgi:hypothetical protein